MREQETPQRNKEAIALQSWKDEPCNQATIRTGQHPPLNLNMLLWSKHHPMLLYVVLEETLVGTCVACMDTGVNL